MTDNNLTPKEKKLNRIALYPMFSALLTAFIFLTVLAAAGILGNNNESFLYGDLYVQYIGFIRMFLRVLKGEADLWYSFSLYLGSGTALTFAYYTLSPFNLLYLIEAVPVSTMTTFIITVKLALSAATFCYFEKRILKKTDFSSILFSLCYALSTWSAAYYIHIMWLDCLYMLPLISIFTIEATDHPRKKTNTLSLILSYSYLFLTNFYIAFMAGIFEALVFLGASICHSKGFNRRTIKNFIFSALHFCICIFLSAGLCGIMLLPAGYLLYSHSAADNFEFTQLASYIPDIIKSLFIGEMPSLNNVTPFLYCSLPVLVLFPFIFFKKNISIKIRSVIGVITVFYVIAMINLPMYTFMHAFDYPNFYAYRFTFCLIFTLCASAAAVFDDITEIKPSHFFSYTVALIILYSAMMPLQTARVNPNHVLSGTTGFFINAAFLAAYMLLYHLRNKNTKTQVLKPVFSLLLCLELAVNFFMCIKHRSFENNDVVYTNLFAAESQAISEVKENDDSFYRISVQNESLSNAPTFYGYAGFNTFSSSDDYNLRMALWHLGIVTSNRVIEEHGYTPLTYMIFGTKYLVTLPDHNELATSRDYSISQYDNYCPLGFMCSPRILDYSAEDNPFINQENLVNLITDGRYHIFEEIDPDSFVIKSYNVALDSEEYAQTFYAPIDSISDTQYLYIREKEENKQLLGCMSVHGTPLYSDSALIVDALKGYYSSSRASFGCIFTPQDYNEADNPDLNLPHSNIGYDVCGLILCNSDRSAIFKNIYFYNYLDNGELDILCKDINTYGMKITDFSASCINGTVDVPKDRTVFFTSIPFDKDWHIYTDGVETDTFTCVDNAFLCCNLPEGTHDIQLRFIPSGYKTGKMLSIISLLISIPVCLLPIFKSEKRSVRK